VGQHSTMRALGQKPYRECAGNVHADFAEAVSRLAPQEFRFPHRSSDIAKETCVATTDPTLHTDLESLPFLPPRNAIVRSAQPHP
jgi:hypothetical protein